MKLINKLLRRPVKPSPEELAIMELDSRVRALYSHVLAIARLQFIKPETLSREVSNIQSNTDYLKKLIEFKDKNAK